VVAALVRVLAVVAGAIHAIKHCVTGHGNREAFTLPTPFAFTFPIRPRILKIQWDNKKIKNYL
jgi:hypothetical protein